ncbi:SIMPL domain-containing protein [Ferruginibacter sp.]|nr:SIMPL domain-containing protein [Ferruginibacter sp.]
MKKIITLLTALLLTNLLIAQSQPICDRFPKTISVTGSAEMEIVPDEIYVQVDLREYKKRGDEKTNIDKIKADFLASFKMIGIADSNIAVASFDGYNLSNIWRQRKKDPDLLASITYQLKFSNTKLIDDLVNKLDDEATNNFRITRTSHSKIIEYRKQLKIIAVKAAKEKAIYLSESVNEQVGPAITITEPEESSSSDILSGRYRSNASNSVYSNSLSKADAYGINDNGVDYRKIKIRYEVKVLYALK